MASLALAADFFAQKRVKSYKKGIGSFIQEKYELYNNSIRIFGVGIILMAFY